MKVKINTCDLEQACVLPRLDGSREKESEGASDQREGWSSSSTRSDEERRRARMQELLEREGKIERGR